MLNGHADKDSILLRKRSRKMPHRLATRGASSAPNNSNAYSKPNATSPIRAYITTPTRGSAQNMSNNMSRLGRITNLATPKSSQDTRKEVKERYAAEHTKVIKHPAPFRWGEITLYFSVVTHHIVVIKQTKVQSHSVSIHKCYETL